MTREQFKAKAREVAQREGWTLDIVEDAISIEAWFSEPHPKDAPGRPYGADTAQAYMRDGQEPVGLDL